MHGFGLAVGRVTSPPTIRVCQTKRLHIQIQGWTLLLEAWLIVSWSWGLEHDLGRYPEYQRANVLLSEDFRYFGIAGSAEYKTRFSEVRRAVERLGRGHRVWHTPALRNEFLQMKDWVWDNYEEKKIGEPTSKPSRSACHRSKSCGYKQVLQRSTSRNSN